MLTEDEDRLAQMRRHAPSPATEWDSAVGWTRFHASVDAPEAVTMSSRAARRLGYPSTRQIAWGVAAAVVIIGALVSRPHVRARRVNDALREYVTAPGQRRSIRLPDGTELTLAPASRLRVAADYGRAQRDVFLNGEAYVTVRHDSEHPFAVHTGGVVIRDVGTIFDARAYPGDSGARVAVVEGKIAVNAVTAGAGEVIVAVGNHAYPQLGAAVSPLTAWMQGALIFDKAPLREVVQDISRTFGLTVTVADSALLSRRITATLSGESLNVVLNIVTQVVGARFAMTAHGVVIQDGPPPAPRSQDAGPLPLTTAQVSGHEP